jgi:thiosulfate dehydrogenase
MRILAALAALACCAIAPAFAEDVTGSPVKVEGVWSVPDVDALPDDAQGRLIRHGHDLMARTYAYLGPEAPDPAKHYSGNNLACENCHLQAGTKRFGLPVVGVAKDFPQYRAREGRVSTLADRINGCMTRSLNGRALPDDSPEMQAFIAYIEFVSTGEKTAGRGAGAMPELTRAGNPVRGKTLYAEICATCHQSDGQGKKRAGMAEGYEFPPLWGPDSFNDGAGMARLISAANFVHSNMPNGTDWTEPKLSAEDAWDIAAYFISQPRPHKADLDQDYPKRLEKTVDAAYGPYADGFPPSQHQFGPYAPIRTRIKEMKEAAAGATVTKE